MISRRVIAFGPVLFAACVSGNPALDLDGGSAVPLPPIRSGDGGMSGLPLGDATIGGAPKYDALAAFSDAGATTQRSDVGADLASWPAPEIGSSLPDVWRPSPAPDSATPPRDLGVPVADSLPWSADSRVVSPPMRLDLVANIYQRNRRDGLSTCARAGTDENYWGGSVTECRNGRARCTKDTQRIVLAYTSMPGGGSKSHLGCLTVRYSHDPDTARVVATIYSYSDGQQDYCQTADDETARRRGYWDEGRSQGAPFSACTEEGRPSCLRGSKLIIMAMTDLPGGRIKYHSACVLRASSRSTNVVATMRSRAYASGRAECWHAEVARPSRLRPWDLDRFSRCRSDGSPSCGNGSRFIMLKMSRLGDNSVIYESACVRNDGVADDERHIWDWLAGER